MRIMKNLFIILLLMLPLIGAANTLLPFADQVVVEKSKRKMYLIKQGVVYREYPISLGYRPLGHKGEEGDKRTPEGRYVIDYRNPESRFYLSLHINYPSEIDQQSAADNGVSPGGEIFIHGQPNNSKPHPSKFRGRDWTDGCIAITNQEIEQFWALVKDGTPIDIRP
jgi:murein L,D-transpeptidase YafK